MGSPKDSGHFTFVDTGHKINSMAILSLPQTEVGQLSDTGELRSKSAQEHCEQITWPAQHDLNSVDRDIKLQIKKIKNSVK